MNEILAVAESVWRRILGLKVVYFLVACTISLIAITVLYKYLMGYQQQMLMVDVSLLLTSIAGLLCVLAIAFDIPRELREGTATTLLSKPLGRTHYLIGKFLGIVIVAIAITLLITVGFSLVHRLAYKTWGIEAIKAHIMTIGSVIPMAAMALLFASFLSEAAAAILTALFVFLCSSVSQIPGIEKITIIYGGIIPDLGLLNLRAEASHAVDIAASRMADTGLALSLNWSYVWLSILWGVLYSVALICATSLIFNRRDLR